MKDKKYVIEPEEDPDQHKKVKVAPSDVNIADRRYKLWLKNIRKLGNWRPKRRVQKTDIFNNQPGIALVENEKTIEKYNLHWVHDHAKGTTSSEEGDN